MDHRFTTQSDRSCVSKFHLADSDCELSNLQRYSNETYSERTFTLRIPRCLKWKVPCPLLQPSGSKVVLGNRGFAVLPFGHLKGQMTQQSRQGQGSSKIQH